MLLLLLMMVGVIVVISLAIYAGVILFKLRQQQIEISQTQLIKATTLSDSIRIIALGVKQEQCDLSEAAIRIVKLLQAMPNHQFDYESAYPALHSLFDKIKHMPTHEQRKQQNKLERRKMDQERLSYETQIKPLILLEIEQLTNFSARGNEV